jgi:hypothetical protein
MGCPRVALRLIAFIVAFAGSTPVHADNSAQAAAAAPADSVFARKLSRWIEVQTLLVSIRYRFLDADDPAPTSDQMQAREGLAFRLLADRRGRVAIGVGALTGPSFVGSWNDTGVGTGHSRFHMGLRQLSFDLTPIKGVVAQVGSLGLARGESTEITTYDLDGYMVGERLTLHRPTALFFDEVVVSRGFLGDATRPALIDRVDRMGDFNYQQYLVARHLNARIAASTEFARLAGTSSVRVAGRVRVPELGVADLVRYEQYLRFDHRAVAGAAEARQTVAGFAVAGEKQVTRRFTAAIGYADIDRDYGGLNGDRFNRGRRVFGTTNYVLSPLFAIATYVTHALGDAFTVANRTRVDVILHYNVLAQLQRAGILH